MLGRVGGEQGQGPTQVIDAPPAPTLEVTVDPRGTFNPQTGTARVSGSYTCTPVDDGEAFVFLDVQLRLRAGRVIIDGVGFQESTQCDGTAQPWTLDIESFDGLYKGGKAEATVFGQACSDEFGCDFFEGTQTVNLSGSNGNKN